MSTSLATSPLTHQQQRTPLKAPFSAPATAKNFGHPSTFHALKSRVPAPPLSPGGRKRGRRGSSDTCTSSPSDNENNEGSNNLQAQQADSTSGAVNPSSRFSKVKDRLKYFDRSMSSLSEKTSRIPFGGIVKARPLPFAQLDDSEHSVLSFRSKNSVHTASSTGVFQQTIDEECKMQHCPSNRALGDESLTPSEVNVTSPSSEPASPVSRPKLRIAVRVKDSPTGTDASKRAAIQKKIVKELSATSVCSITKSSRSIAKALHESKVRVAVNDCTPNSDENGNPTSPVSSTELGSKKVQPIQELSGTVPRSGILPRLLVDNSQKSGGGTVQTDSAIKGSYLSNASVSTDVAVTSETRSSVDRDNVSRRSRRPRPGDAAPSSEGSTKGERDEDNVSPLSRFTRQDCKERSTPTSGRGRVPRPSSPSRANRRISSPSPARAPLQLTMSGRVVNMENYNPLSGSYHVRSKPQSLDRVEESKMVVHGQRALPSVASCKSEGLDVKAQKQVRAQSQRSLNPSIESVVRMNTTSGMVQLTPKSSEPKQRLKRTVVDGKVAAYTQVMDSSTSSGLSSHSNYSQENVSSTPSGSCDRASTSTGLFDTTQQCRNENQSSGQVITELICNTARDSTITAPKTPRRTRDDTSRSPWGATPRSRREAAIPASKSPFQPNGVTITPCCGVKPSPWGVRLRSSSSRELSASIPAPPLSPNQPVPNCSTPAQTSPDPTLHQSTKANALASELDRPMERVPKSPMTISASDHSTKSPTSQIKLSEQKTPRSKCGRKGRITAGEQTPSKAVKDFASSFVFGSKLLNNSQPQDLSGMALVAKLPSPPLSPSKVSSSPDVRARDIRLNRQPESPGVDRMKSALDIMGSRTPSARRISSLDSISTPDSSDLLPVKDRLRLFQALESVNKEIMKAREQVSARRRMTFSERQKLRLESAKRIQARARGMIQRQKHRQFLAARAIQAFVRRRILQYSVRRRQAAIRIQAFGRGIVPRFKYRLRALHLNLDIVKQRKRNDLMLIQLRKWKVMEEMRKEIDELKAFETSTDDLEKMQVEISQLKRQNSSYLETNHKLMEMQLQLKMMRMMTEQTLSIHNKNYETMEEAVNVLSEKNEALLNKLQRLEERITRRQLEQDELKHRVQYEKKVRALTEKAISTIVEVVEARSDDPRLTKRILAISNDEETDDEESMGVCSNAAKSYRTNDGTTEGGFELSFRVTGLEDDEISMLDVESTVGPFFSAREQRHRCDSKLMFEDLDVTEEEEILEEFEFVEEVLEEDSDGDGCSCESSVYEERSVII